MSDCVQQNELQIIDGQELVALNTVDDVLIKCPASRPCKLS